MGCITSKSEEQLGAIKPWDYKVNGEKKTITEEELQNLRKVRSMLCSQQHRIFGIVAQKGTKMCGMCSMSVVTLC